MSTVQDRRLAIIQRIYREWAAEQATIQPDAQFAREDADGFEVLTAPPSSIADLQHRTDRALRAAGLPVTFPDRISDSDPQPARTLEEAEVIQRRNGAGFFNPDC